MFPTAAPVIDYDSSLSAPLRLKGGSSLILTVNITGEPKPESHWFLEDVEIHPDEHTQIEGDGTFSRLTVKDVSTQNAGKYKVTAENKVGATSAAFDVAIQGES